MTRWAAFAGVTLAVLSLLLVVARASQAMVTAPRGGERSPGSVAAGGHFDAVETDVRPGEEPSPAPSTVERDEGQPPSTPGLFANVAISHALFAGLLVAGILLTDVPWSALGVSADPISSGLPGVAVGIGLGGAVALANAVAAGLADAFGADPSRDLRELLAPETRWGWLVLLSVVLPLVAGFEELLFRAALIGGFAAGFGLSPWLLAVLSSVAFAAGHGAQGGPGVVVTGLLGLALAVAFVLTGSLLVVVLAHYVVNTVEFVVGEGLGWRPFG
ncbi:CPBP family intramembrane metalloprotease [Halobacteriales archaeon SW_12_69_24]|nr:MAG: CPBP family intramembrane metalloprotease [Halobacteriales archaeon SW_12_69_24]